MIVFNKVFRNGRLLGRVLFEYGARPLNDRAGDCVLDYCPDQLIRRKLKRGRYKFPTPKPA